MMKRWITAAMSCVLLLSGCGKSDVSADTPTAPPADISASSSADIPSVPPVEERGNLEAFRAALPDSSAKIAVAYLGYVHLGRDEDLGVYLESNGFYEQYPFLSDLTNTHFVRQEGGELYAVIPVCADTALTVSACYVDEQTYTMEQGDVLAEFAPGQAVIVQGNVSEICPNLWVTAKTAEEETLHYMPSLSMENGRLMRDDSVCDVSDYELLDAIWQAETEHTLLCGTWYAQAADGEGLMRAMKLSLGYGGTAEYSYGIPESDVLEAFEGTWTESDGILTLQLRGGPASTDGSAATGNTYDTVCSFVWEYESRQLLLCHSDGGSLLYGTEGEMFTFLPFDAYTMAGVWSAEAPDWGWEYELSLLSNGECSYRITENGREAALYEGWWFAAEDGYVSLDVGLNSGQHPETPETEYISGMYLAEKNGSAMELTFASGSILTVGMEENGWEHFTLVSEGTCVSVHYASDLAVNLEDCDWVIVDDTLPVEAAFCTMVPVEDFTVVSLFLQGDGMTFDVTELFEYGTLTPERPLHVTFTSYGSIPSYGISFIDPNGTARLFGVNVSGMDGSLELVELP